MPQCQSKLKYSFQRNLKCVKGLSIKDVRVREGGVFGVYSVRTWGGDSSDADVRNFWCKKLRIFRNSWRVLTNKGDEPVRGGHLLLKLKIRLTKFEKLTNLRKIHSHDSVRNFIKINFTHQASSLISLKIFSKNKNAT